MTGFRNGVLTCSLKRKRCACGKQVTALQLVRYEMCDACLKAKVHAAKVRPASTAVA